MICFNHVKPIILFVLLVLSLACTAQKMDESLMAKSENEMTNQSLKPPHHTENGFQNHPYIPTAAPKGFMFYLRRFWGSIVLPDVPESHRIPQEQAIVELAHAKHDYITWLGHASFLINIGGITILTDPFLTQFASPFTWAGPQRYVPPGISLEQLPDIDVILISHNHYDHLDDRTISQLREKQRIQVLVPLGVKNIFLELGYENIVELDWYNSFKVANLNFTALPAVHDSARSTNDHNQSLWASWLIETPHIKLYFIGDSAYSNTIFKNIGQKFSPIDFVFVPISAYEPRELMWMSHVTPEEAVTIAKEVAAKILIASHWGTINLSDEPPWEPPKRFRAAGLGQGFSEKTQWILKIGETRKLLTR